MYNKLRKKDNIHCETTTLNIDIQEHMNCILNTL